jgi:hypothetical protein
MGLHPSPIYLPGRAEVALARSDRTSSVMKLRARVARIGLLVVLIAISLPVAIQAQQFVCWPIGRGDTAAGLARRLTGTTATVYTEWFQIRDPGRAMFVPKSHYERISTSWEACVVHELLARAATAPPPQRASSYDMSLVWRVGITVTLALFACSMIVKYVPDRAIPPDMQRAGEAFVNAFAWPLIDPSSDVPPIRARLRFVRHRQQLEICIAPHGARRYPNLLDHKTNVEYDVHRVARLLPSHVVVGGGLRAEGKWIVVPIRRANFTQAGAK